MNRKFRFILWGIVVFQVIYATGILLFGPYFIEQAYRQESFAFINQVLDDGRDSHALQFYIRIWHLYAWWFWLAATGFGLSLLLVSHDAARQHLENVLQRTNETKKRYDWRKTIPNRRRMVIHCIILIILFGSLYDIFSGKEHWPFSPYYMYSYVQPDTFGWNLLYGITETDGEVPLGGKNSGQYLHPYEESRAARGFFNLNSRPNREDLLRKALNEVLHRYETNRRDGRHSGPNLRGIRLYHEEWDMTPSPQSKGKPPDRRKLLMEVIR